MEIFNNIPPQTFFEIITLLTIACCINLGWFTKEKELLCLSRANRTIVTSAHGRGVHETGVAKSAPPGFFSPVRLERDFQQK